jgi:NADH:ubiquinone oxidoreductase subunit F (NADH-binding)/DMSO/TMAO reductase YedYZ heme-binding membrane subunit
VSAILAASIGPSTYWYLTRATGTVALLLLTASVVLGVLDVSRFSSQSWPRFMLDALHRSVSLLSLVFLVLHVITTLLDSFAPISIVAAFIPFTSSYRSFWLGLGAVSFDLMLALVITSLMRRRFGFSAWRTTHWLAYACWPIALIHGLGTGSDVKSSWMLLITIGCVLAMLAAVVSRTMRGWPDHVRARSAAIGALRPAWQRMGAQVGHAHRPVATLREERSRRRQHDRTDGRRSMSSRLQDPAEVATLPRLLLGIAPEGALSLQEHLALHGPLPSVEASRGRRLGRRGSLSPLIDEVERAGLLGRGGARFPTASKLRAVAGARSGSARPIIVVNATEGEPASTKDRLLLQSLPHLVLDGTTLAAQALGAEEAIVCVCQSNSDLDHIKRALAERRSLHERLKLSFSVVANGYVTGQESALVQHLNGGPALPTFTPPMPFERGVRGCPTFISNAETLAHLAMIARRGADWYRELGTPSQPGSTLVTLSGPVSHPGVYEIEHGASLSSLIDAAGGLASTVRSALIGGYAGTWIDARMLHAVALCDEQLAPLGASVGSGVVALLSAQACPIAETARLMRWLADQSAGQCGPCVNGLHSISATFAEIASGTTKQRPQNLTRLIALTRGRGACRHPDGAVRLIESALEVFAEELEDHALHGACEACHRNAELPLPAWSDLTRSDRARHTVKVGAGGLRRRIGATR